MFKKKTIAAALVAATALTAAPASATNFTFDFGFGGNGFGWHQPWRHGGPGWNHRPHHGPRWHHQRLSQQQVRWILRDRGYRWIEFMNHRGPVYQVRARKWGHTYYLVISARDGQILSRHRI